MSNKDTQPSPRKRRNLLGRLFRLAFFLAILAVIAGVAVKYYIAPKLIAKEVKAYVEQYWVGSVEVGEVRFNFTEPITLHGLVLRDQLGDTWLSEDLITVQLSNWPSLTSKVTDLDFHQPALTAYGGRPSPFVTPANTKQSNMVDLRDVLLDGAELTLVRKDGQRKTLRDVRVSLSLRGGQWRVQSRFGKHEDAHTLTGQARIVTRPDGSKVIDFTGRADLPDAEANIVASIITPAGPDGELVASVDVEAADIYDGRAELHITTVRPRVGSPQYDLRVSAAGLDLRALTMAWQDETPRSGKLRSLQFNASLSPEGKLVVSLDIETEVYDGRADLHLAAALPRTSWQRFNINSLPTEFDLDALTAAWQAMAPRGGELASLQISAKAAGLDLLALMTDWQGESLHDGELSSAHFNASLSPMGKLVLSADVEADIYDGQAQLQAQAMLPPTGSPQFNVSATAADVDLLALTTAWQFDTPQEGTLASLRVNASGSSTRSLDGLKANGLFFLDDMTVVPDSILDTILDAISPESITQERSDVQAVFSMAGPVVTIHSGIIGGEMISLDIEADSTINVRTHELNGVAVVVIMREISQLADFVPMLGILNDFGNGLKRWQVTGTWDEPIAVPLPVDLLANKGLKFLDSIGPSGGHLRMLMLVPMRSIFDTLPSPPPLDTNGD